MRMSKNAAKVFGLAATTLFYAGGFSSCGLDPLVNDNPKVYGPPSYFGEEDETDETSASEPSITSQWTIESWTLNGKTTYPLDGDDESVLPRFHTDDGETFSLTITGENEYHGELVLQEDGTYQLIHEDDTNILVARIDGDKLTITLPTGTYLTFVIKED